MKPNFAEIIARQYQNRTGERRESVKPFAEVFDIAVESTMSNFEQNYHEIFKELTHKSSEEFYKMIFSKDQESTILEEMVISPCLLKDFFDEHLDEIKAGGGSAKIICNLSMLIEEKKSEDLHSLATYWNIARPEWRITKEIYSIDDLKCSSIPDTPIDFDKRVFTELLRENLPELVFYLEAKLGFSPPLRDITNEEKAALGLKWADKIKTVRFAEGEALEDVRLLDTSGELVVKEASNVAQNVVVHGEGKIAEPNVRK